MTEEDRQSDPLPDRSRRRRQVGRRRVILIGLLGIVAAGAIALLIIARRADRVIADVKQDVIASYNLAWRAFAQYDTDVFKTLLPNNDPEWRRIQLELFERGLLLHGGVLGLTMTAPPRLGLDDVILSPDLNRAEVVFDQVYTVEASDGLTQTVSLRHTDIYRLIDQRWLLTRPDQADQCFWCAAKTSAGRMLTLKYPERDEAVGRRLAGDLDSVLLQLCAQPIDVTCPLRLKVDLDLITDPFSVSQLGQPETSPVRFETDSRGTIDEVHVALPAPSLLSVPIDEAGYQAFSRNYATRLVGALMGGLVGRDRVLENSQVYQAVLDRQLIQLGLKPWPAAPIDDAPGVPPIALPDRDIQLYCAESLTRGDLYRYSPSQRAWTKELADRVYTALYPAPNDDGVILHAPAIGKTPERISRWQNGREQILIDAPAASMPIVYTGQTDPSGQKAIVQISGDRNQLTIALLDLDQCLLASCRWEALPAWPEWSPDGSQTILTARQSGILFRGDRQAKRLAAIGDGFGPFWIDNRTFGYLRAIPTTTRTQTPSVDIVLVNASTGREQVVLSTQDLLVALPKDVQPDRFFIQRVIPRQPNSDRLLIEAESTTGRYFFSFSLQSGALALMQSNAVPGYLPSPDGRWLAASVYEGTVSNLSLDLRSQTRSLTFPYPYSVFRYDFPQYDWSADGQWLLALSDGVIRLIAPDHDYQRTIVPPVPGCVFAAWIKIR